jgi:molybdopterin molybdotransferase
MAAGASVAPAGTPVTPALLGLAAGLAVDVLSVRGPARVLALIIGNEVGLTGLPGNGRIRDSIGPMLPGLVPALGGRLAGIVRLGDRLAEVTEAVRKADAEVVVSCGASSVGRSDTVRASLRALSARLVVDGVSCRPGHPQALAEFADGRWLVALPGNPYAALVAAMTLLAPLLHGLAGRTLPELPTATLTGDVRAHTDRTRLVPVTSQAGTVTPIGTDRPASLHGAALAEALAVIPADWAGEPVQLVDLPR